MENRKFAVTAFQKFAAEYLVTTYWSCYCIKFIKRLNEDLRLQLLGKNPKFLSDRTFKLVGKHLNRGG